MDAQRSPRSTGRSDEEKAETGHRKAHPDRRLTTQQRRKRMDAITWGAILTSVLLHFVVLSSLPDFDAPDFAVAADELELAELPPEVEIPPPPEAIARPAVPVVSDNLQVDEDITIAPTTFAANPVEDLPPPPEETDSGRDEIYEAPTFTPYSVAPDLTNRREALSAVLREWPDVMKNAGIEGVVVVWFFIDETGEVQNVKVSRSSGIKQLDEAALRAAREFEFSPALNREEPVPVWVQLPITFQQVQKRAG
ncbi:MAG: TonB family protein [Longimicrobiales bacterium]|nr:TonB family protein [Longimicrobiales bacterium]